MVTWECPPASCIAAHAFPPVVRQQEPRETDKELRGNIRGLLTRAKRKLPRAVAPPAAAPCAQRAGLLALADDKHNLISVENNSIVDLVKESNQLVEQGG